MLVRPYLPATAVLLLLLASCTPPSATAGADAGGALAPSGTCTRFGQTCDFAPGKLGTCVQKTGCEGAGCLVCQSQH